MGAICHGSPPGKPRSLNIGANDEATKDGGRAASLGRVLEHSEHLKGLVEECAADLASVNGALSRALTAHDAPPGLAGVLGQSAALAVKVQAVSVALSVVNRALQVESRDRSLVNLRVAAAEEQEQAGRHAALHDALTGLPNRALFNDRLEHAIAQASRHSWILAVMFVDLDDFKAINDTHGHDVGDSMLRAIARRLRNATRSEDTVSRHGGDEFLYLLTPVRDEANIAMIAAKVLQVVQAPCDIRIRDGQISLGVRTSIGVAIFPKDGITVHALIKNADAAMYKAKQAKSGVAFA
jgi:diguanylate cyclase (GGDEF)-like protein